MRTLLIAVVAAGSLAAQDVSKKQVVCTLPVLKSIADELSGGGVEVTALSKPDQDPHFVSPTPALMKKLREAELFIEIGLQLELWADEVANGSSNGRIAKGAGGRLIASNGVSREEIPQVVDRKLGDVHPEGNPHIWLSPPRVKLIAENIAEGLKRAEPSRSADIDKRLQAFKDRVDEALFGADLVKEVGARSLTRKALDGSLLAYLDERKLGDKIGGWLKKAAPLRGQKVVQQHKIWVYFAKLFDFQLVGSVEERPWIPPGPPHLRQLIDTIRNEKVRLIVVDNFYDPANARWLAEQTGAKVAIVPDQPGGEAGTDDYFKFIDHVLDRMLEALK